MDNTDDIELKKNPDDDDLVRIAKKRFKKAQDWESTSRLRFVEDIKFTNGDSRNLYQWPEGILNARGYGTNQEKPNLTINKTMQHCLQIINDGLQNKTSVKIKPTGNGATYEAAQVMEGIVRHIEYISDAQSAYSCAATFQVQGGIGYVRVTTDYLNDESFDQEIYIKPIPDPLSVYMDPDAQQADGSDMRYAFVFTDMPRDEFRIQYPDYPLPARGLPVNTLDNASMGMNWIEENHVRVAEYYYREEIKDTLVVFTNPHTGEKESLKVSDLAGMSGKLKAAYEEQLKDPYTKTRDIISHQVKWVKIAGDYIVDRKDWVGSTIPIAYCVGIQTIIDGELDRKGHTRALLDSQRMLNYNSPLSLDTPIATPSGWTTMGQIKVNDYVFDETGKPAKVIGQSETHRDRNCYKIFFDNGDSIVADADHLWTVKENSGRDKQGIKWVNNTITTKELVVGKHFITISKELDLPKVDLPIDPYVLGVWLGDGNSHSPRITTHIDDCDEIMSNLSNKGFDITSTWIKSAPSVKTIAIHGLAQKLKDANLTNNKHIPEIYLRASRDQREQLLQGLMDTDGNISEYNQCSFVNVDSKIIEGFKELINSLGIKSTNRIIKGFPREFPNGRVYDTKDSTRFHFTIGNNVKAFKLSRKASKQSYSTNNRTRKHNIKFIKQVPSVLVKCITVDSPNHLFLAGKSMIPTHNSASVEYGALQSKTPYLAPAEAIEGYQTYWETANIQDYAVLPWNHKDDEGRDIPPPIKVQPPMGAPLYQQGAQDAIQQMMEVSGQYQAEFGQPSNERSGKAIQARQRQGENSTYHFIDHQARMLRRIGKIIVDLIPKIYDTKRTIKILGEDGSDSDVMLDPQAKLAYEKRTAETEEAAEQVIMNPSVGQYDVMSDVGPDYGTRRQEAFNALSQIAAQNPELMSVIGDLVMMAADFPMADEAAERLRRMVPAQALGEGVNPQVAQLQKEVQSTQALMASMTTKLVELQTKNATRDEQKDVDVYKAITDRLDIIMKYTNVPEKDKLAFQHDLAMQEHQGNLNLASKVIDANLNNDVDDTGV